MTMGGGVGIGNQESGAKSGVTLQKVMLLDVTPDQSYLKRSSSQPSVALSGADGG